MKKEEFKIGNFIIVNDVSDVSIHNRIAQISQTFLGNISNVVAIKFIDKNERIYITKDKIRLMNNNLKSFI